MNHEEGAELINSLTSLSSDLSVFCWKLLLAKPSWKSESADVVHKGQSARAERRVTKSTEWIWKDKRNTHSTRQLDAQVWSSTETHELVRKNRHTGRSESFGSERGHARRANEPGRALILVRA